MQQLINFVFALKKHSKLTSTHDMSPTATHLASHLVRMDHTPNRLQEMCLLLKFSGKPSRFHLIPKMQKFAWQNLGPFCHDGSLLISVPCEYSAITICSKMRLSPKTTERLIWCKERGKCPYSLHPLTTHHTYSSTKPLFFEFEVPELFLALLNPSVSILLSLPYQQLLYQKQTRSGQKTDSLFTKPRKLVPEDWN